MTKQTSSLLQQHLGLVAAVAFVAFMAGGLVVGALWLWRGAAPKGQSAAINERLGHKRRQPVARARIAPSVGVGQGLQEPTQIQQRDGLSSRSIPARPVPSRSVVAPGQRQATPAKRRSATPPAQKSQKSPKEQKPQAASGGSGQVWGAPDWTFDPQGGLIGQLRLVSLSEVKQVVGFAHLRSAILQGIPRSGVYDAVQFRPTKPLPRAPDARYGVGIQLWLHPEQAPILYRWKRYQRGYPNARLLPKGQRVGRDSFVAQRAPIRYLLFRTSRRHGLLILSCHEALCTRRELVTLARRIDQRIL